jgi:hypothetical protein
MSYSNIHSVLKDETRRKIIDFIGRRGRVTYTDILRELGISTGKLNYHLRILSPVLDKQDNDQYYLLNDLGRNAFSLLQGFKEDQHVGNGNAILFRRLSWVLLALSILAMYYGFFGNSGAQIALGFLSSSLLVSSIFLLYYSRKFDFKLRHILMLSFVALGFGAPISVQSSQWLFIASNPFHTDLMVNFSASLVNSIIFFPTILAWSLTGKGRIVWMLSALIVSLATIFPIVTFLVGVANSQVGFASLTSSISNCTTTRLSPNATGTSCSSFGNLAYVSLQPLFLILTVFSSKIFPRFSEPKFARLPAQTGLTPTDKLTGIGRYQGRSWLGLFFSLVFYTSTDLDHSGRLSECPEVCDNCCCRVCSSICLASSHYSDNTLPV